MPRLIYKYANVNDEYLKVLMRQDFSCTCYGKFDDQGELSFDFDETKLENIKYRNLSKEHSIVPIIKHIKQYYYLSSLSESNPFELGSELMWENYANKNGICIVYKTTDIERARIRYIRNNPEIACTIDEVTYGDGPLDFYNFANTYFNLVGDLEDENEIEQALNKLPDELEKIGDRFLATKILTYKNKTKGDFKETNEWRLVVCNPKKIPETYYSPFKVKPFYIVISKSISEEFEIKVKRLCFILEIPCVKND